MMIYSVNHSQFGDKTKLREKCQLPIFRCKTPNTKIGLPMQVFWQLDCKSLNYFNCFDIHFLTTRHLACGHSTNFVNLLLLPLLVAQPQNPTLLCPIHSYHSSSSPLNSLSPQYPVPT